ncbi:ribonuclease III [Cronbergia sp. UHCC 0137]|uniref:ribonuclease III n=1 Tax=Cronbergia sp. UHCC 0137 TaxID=3110239 RepID=UPI002B2112F0|nr:ribonuclease III [Cronbergia sp. UHCC 0137]MEA5619291.1 ribonuclease III [Cronbergia sp. UHCC 0137]
MKLVTTHFGELSMGVSNQERIGKALDFLRQGLFFYTETKMQAVHGSNWMTKATSHLSNHKKSKQQVDKIIREDVSALLTIVNREWDNVFRNSLSQPDRALVNELIEVRNQWAHQSTFSTDDTYRAVDSVLRLLRSISSPQVAEMEKQRQDVLRLLTQEQARHEVRPIPVSPAEESRIRNRLDELLKRIPFQNAYLLNQALTHTSYKYENPNTGEDNEQLEFIGDALLTFLSGDFLYKRNPDLREGKLTILRSNLVDTPQLAKFAAELDIGKWMRLGRGEDISGGRSKPSLLCNVFEAIVGAYYLDSGVEAVRDLVDPFFEKVVNDLPTTEDSIPSIRDDVKGWLQQVVLDSGFAGNPSRRPPEYKTERSGGSDNNPEFISVVYVAGSEYGRGKDSSTRKAEKRAAEDALHNLGLL